MKLGIVIYADDAETAWNALRLANFSLARNDEVKVFLVGKGVTCPLLDREPFQVTEQLSIFNGSGGRGFACGTCLEIHQLAPPEAFAVATLTELYRIVADSDRVLTF